MFYASTSVSNKKQNFISNFIFQFINKTEWNFRYTDYPQFFFSNKNFKVLNT